MVDLSKLEQVYERARHVAYEQSSAMKALQMKLSRYPKLIISKLEEQDHNQDGLLNVDGFIASLMIGEVGLQRAEITECFYLICNSEQMLSYRRWILQQFPDFKTFFTINVTPREPSIRMDESGEIIPGSLIETSMNERSSHRSMTIDNASNRAKYMSVKNKIEQYMIQSEYNISMMFAIMDTNSDN